MVREAIYRFFRAVGLLLTPICIGSEITKMILTLKVPRNEFDQAFAYVPLIFGGINLLFMLLFYLGEVIAICKHGIRRTLDPRKSNYSPMILGVFMWVPFFVLAYTIGVSFQSSNECSAPNPPKIVTMSCLMRTVNMAVQFTNVGWLIILLILQWGFIPKPRFIYNPLTRRYILRPPPTPGQEDNPNFGFNRFNSNNNVATVLPVAVVVGNSSPYQQQQQYAQLQQQQKYIQMLQQQQQQYMQMVQQQQQQQQQQQGFTDIPLKEGPPPTHYVPPQRGNP